MGNPALNEALTTLAEKLAPTIGVSRDTVLVALASLDWRAERDLNLVRDANGMVFDGTNPHGDEVEPCTPLVRHRLSIAFVRDETEPEVRAREDRIAALLWRPQDGPPVKEVTTLQLLRQDVWWRTRDGQTLHIDQMAQPHRENTYRYLLRNAVILKRSAEFEASMLAHDDSPMGGPSEHVRDAMLRDLGELERTTAHEWIAGLPLMRALREYV